ncbi:MAG: hypothetical protein ABI357_08460 [Granulicella sp.]
MPLVLPARYFTYPMRVAGEESALARGALLLMVKPEQGVSFLAICARGFRSESMPTGVFACPNPQEMCAVAGGYAYLVNMNTPERCTQIGLKPVVSVLVSEARRLLIFVGFHSIVAWGAAGLAWETAKLSWEGVRIVELGDETLVGFGWDLMTDQEVEFRVDLRTGLHEGGIVR